VQMICAGTKKQTNYHRQLTTALTKGIVPDRWLRYDIPFGMTVIQWIADFAQRAQQLTSLAQAASQAGDAANKALKKVHICLGSLFSPEAYITATRQYVAQANSWSLEELTLSVTVGESFDKMTIDDCSFGITGMRLLGAQCQNDRQLALMDRISSDMTAVKFTWMHTVAGTKRTPAVLELPVYLYADRKRLLTTLEFDTVKGASASAFYERGVAVVAHGTIV